VRNRRTRKSAVAQGPKIDPSNNQGPPSTIQPQFAAPCAVAACNQPIAGGEGLPEAAVAEKSTC